MKTYQDWLVESTQFVPNKDSCLIDQNREACPQIVDHDAMVADLSNNGIMTYNESADPRQFVPTQNEFDWSKVQKINDDKAKGKIAPPYVVSRDNTIIDGHHRFLADANDGTQNPSRVFRINLNYEQFVRFVKDKPYIKYKTLGNKVVAQP